ncbi:alpha/beta-hydrolase [Corynespora cassiicola Philippines]|uniref:Alpha/beta-hydrolase n=1 Tax=Corynespora cassiicola Philippines TaxID=1448308 RepID=A0A2T2NE77_CORCC|nr:alpha/beta-hydrolase [Corynespora cassiicola Philippines]
MSQSTYIFSQHVGHPHTHTVILLHGRSSTAKEFATELFSLSDSSGLALPSLFPSFRWVFPDAGKRWCTAHKDERSAWFDTFSLDDLSQRQDLQVAGLRDSIRHVGSVFESEVDLLGGHGDKVILGGFSQGAATALWSLFTGAILTKGGPRAFLGLSPWLPFTAEAEQAVAKADDMSKLSLEVVQSLTTRFLDIIGVPEFAPIEDIQNCFSNLNVCLGHDTEDAVVRFEYCQRIHKLLQKLRVNAQLYTYSGAERQGHWIKEPEQMDDITRLLRKWTTGYKIDES